MRGYDEDDDEDLFEEHDGEQEQEQEQEQDNGDDNDNENEDEEDETMGGDDDEDGGDHSDDDGSDDDEEEEDQDEDDDGENDDDDDDDEEDDEEDRSDDEGEGEGGDVEMGERNGSATGPSSPKAAEIPPHLLRRRGFVPAYPPGFSTLSLDAVVGISSPSAVHSLATSLCSSYLLSGSQDGHIRAYDIWSSVNGNQLMTAQQRSVVGLGEGVNKAGVSRGWWNNEVEQGEGEDAWRALEPVYSLACESDGLWAAAGTRSGPINLFTLRHSPGHLVHALKGHNNVVSCLSLLPDERHLLSGSWDGTVRDWDLNTGQAVRMYPTHGAQISSLALRPNSQLAAEPLPSVTNGVHVSVNAGPDFFAQDRPTGPTANGHSSPPPGSSAAAPEVNETDPKTEPRSSPAPPAEEAADATTPVVVPDGDILMDTAPSPYDPLFDDMSGDADAEGESVLPSNDATAHPTPSQTPAPLSNGFGLALPGSKPTTSQPSVEDSKPSTASAPLFSQANAQAGPSRSGAGAAGTIPLLTRTTYDAFSEDIMMTSSMDGQVTLIDRRVPAGSEGGVGRLQGGERAPPWCMSACWSGDGNQVLAGRRNGTIDIWDVRRSSSSTAPNLLRTLKTPSESGFISCVVGFTDGRHVATASQDNIRLWNTVEYFEPEDSMKKSKSRPPFKIIAGHHGGTISSMVVDPTNRFLITASGDRGWQGESTKVVLIHDIKAS